MKKTTAKKPDHIDAELSRTYFGGSSRAGSGETASPKPSESAKTSPKRPFPSAKRILIVISTLVVAAILVLRFIGHKQLVLNVSLKDIEYSPPGDPSSAIKAGNEKPATRSYSAVGIPESARLSGGRTLYDFEKSDDGWEIPGWALEKTDHVARSINVVEGVSASGSGSLEIMSEFPGDRWTAALIEIQQYLDLSSYEAISADIFLPPEAPQGLRGKIIVTVGEDWRFVEMARSVRLAPGKWTTITAALSEGSMDWKRTKVDSDFKSDVRKIAIRIESNRKPVYSGPVYVDNITVYSANFVLEP